MNTTNYKPVSESARVSDEKTSKCKAFAGMKLSSDNLIDCFYLFFKIFYLFIFRERGRQGERGGVKHQSVVASCATPTRDLACNPGMCPD